MEAPVAVVLAAGKGTRMQSELPKVLLPVGGRPMIEYVLDALQAAGIGQVLVVVGHRAELVRARLADRQGVRFVDQTEQLGTGHAVAVCRPSLESVRGPVVVVAGDSPLLQPESLARLLAEQQQTGAACVLGTLHKPDPRGLGRVVRDAEGNFQAIVEERDATPEERLLTEVNMSTYVFDCQPLLGALDLLRSNNRQREFYLTDCPGILRGQGYLVRALAVLRACESLSVNTPDELAAVEAELGKLSG
ncbi:MAG: NTP transferase domain-containing protein [Pirellulaceae bacterium]|nr:NTP transferase domain-containing protein [Pirellulaceae bacterium]